MNIFHVALVITLIPADVVPKPSLPDAPLSLLPASLCKSLPCRNLGGKSGSVVPGAI
jgi:hypothetical protein